MNPTTKITTASVRVMRSIDYGNYETSLTVENLDGLTKEDIADAIQKAHNYTNDSMAIYLAAKRAETPVQKKSVQQTYQDLTASRELRDNVPPTEAEKIASLPQYTPKIKTGKKAVAK